MTGDDKSDWWHRANNAPFHPRTELVEEFRRASDGKTFHMVSLAELLELFNADEASVREVQKKETDWLEGLYLNQVFKRDRGYIAEVLFQRIGQCLSFEYKLHREMWLDEIHMDALLAARTVEGTDYVIEVKLIQPGGHPSALDDFIRQTKMYSEACLMRTGRKVIPVVVCITFDGEGLEFARSSPEPSSLERAQRTGDVLVYTLRFGEISDLSCEKIYEMFPVDVT